MTMTTKTLMICECGHRGHIKLKENDTPYSVGFWEKYSVENLTGVAYVTESSRSWTELIKKINPGCPVCGRKLTEKNIQPDK